jgi:glc operon protein GlcG
MLHGQFMHAQENTMHMQPVLGHDDAAAATATIRAELARLGKPAVIAVVDAHGELLSLVRLDGAPLSSVTIATNKAFTAARLRRPSREVGANIRTRGTDIAFYGDPRYLGFGGALPVYVDGVVVGAVAVSGLSDDEDEALAALGIAQMARGRAQSAPA